jgi:GGDEF domain-containing protein
MNKLKSTLFWATLYLAVVFIFGLSDNVDRPIINFASYFYLAVLVAFPVTVFFPSISNVSPYVPMLAWAGIYMVILQIVDRSASTEAIEYAVIILEFVLLELGVWLAHRLAMQIGQAESFMETLALGAFPSRARTIEQEHQQIKKEFARSRRYDRPLSLVVIEAEPENEASTTELLRNIHDDLLHRFRSARVGQVIDEYTRQTDLILKDHRGRFVILCPETDDKIVALLAERLARNVKERTGLNIRCGVASFPDDALSFDDLVQKARDRLTYPVMTSAESVAAAGTR